MNHFKLAIFLFTLAVAPISRAKPGERIIGGQNARAGQFPYAASIYITTLDGNYFCGGTLLNHDWILTAAQCIDGAILFTIRLGTLNLSSNDGIRVAADTYFLHPAYNPDTLENDIGLIKLRLPISYNTYIQPVNFIADHDTPEGTPVTTVGWGQTSDQDEGLNDHLQYVQVVTLSNDECKLTFGDQIVDTMLCVDGSFNQGTCTGDIGSPLIQYGSRGYTYHVGVSSFISGNGCESTDPSGYTRTAEYSDWIKNVTMQ